MDLQDRVTELESRLAFQDDTIETLNDILVTQQRAVERLQLQMTALLKRQEEMGGQFESSEEEAPLFLLRRLESATRQCSDHVFGL